MTGHRSLLPATKDRKGISMRQPHRPLKTLAIPAVFLALTFVPAFPGRAAPASGSLRQAVRQMMAHPDMKHAAFAMLVLPRQGGKPLFEHNADLNLSPASVVKLAVTGAALSLLGESFRFETVLARDGKVNSRGALEGSLVIRGGGDPTLGLDEWEPLFTRWTAKLREAGIRSIEGDVVGDARLFDSRLAADRWCWEDVGNYYGVGASGLSFHRNRYWLHLRPGKAPGAPAAVSRTEPFVADLRFVNEMTTGPQGSGARGYIYGGPYSTVRILRGTVPAGRKEFAIAGALPDPALACASTFRDFLVRNGLPVKGRALTARLLEEGGKPLLGDATPLFTHRSETLGEIVKLTNLWSLNLNAEAMLKMLGLRVKGEGSSRAGIEAVKEHWKSRGVDMKGFFLEDGCGLSPMNGMSPRHLGEILVKMAQTPVFETFYESLAVAGRTGTLKSFGKGTAAEGRIRAKSGSMTRVRSYAGYAVGRKGRPLVFAAMANDFDGSSRNMKRRLQEVLAKMVESY